MAAKKVTHRAKKATNNKEPPRKVAMGRKKDASLGTGDSIVDAARRRWLSAESSTTSRVVSPPGSVGRLGTKISR